MEAYDHEVLDRTAHEIVAQRTGAMVTGPTPLPPRIERYTVLRSPHIDRKSREQFEIRTHKRLIDILQPTGKTIEALNKGLSLPPGVDIKIRVLSGAASRYERFRNPGHARRRGLGFLFDSRCKLRKGDGRVYRTTRNRRQAAEPERVQCAGPI